MQNAPNASFEILGQIKEMETIAKGKSIRGLKSLREMYGAGNWRKLKGIAPVRLEDGTIRTAELHWYEAHGIGRRGMKRKRIWRE
jgi:hypothetical protein